MFPITCFTPESCFIFFHLLSDSASVSHPAEILFLRGDGQEAVPSRLVNTIRDHKCTVGRLRTPADDENDGLGSHQLPVSRPRPQRWFLSYSRRVNFRSADHKNDSEFQELSRKCVFPLNKPALTTRGQQSDVSRVNY